MATLATEKTNENVQVTTSRVFNVLVLQHEADTPAGLIGRAAEAEGALLTVLCPLTDELPKSVDNLQALLVLGSLHSVNDPSQQGWLAAEIALIQQCDAAEIPVFGICFGAQALAVALGGSVQAAPYGEYSWKMVDSVAPSVIPEGPWFQWHVDAITPPASADVLATSDCCVQAFTVGRHLGVQFHPEVDLQQATDWPPSDEAGFATLKQSHSELLAISEALLPEATERATALWHAFIDNAESAR
jgi:GMP synthase-like glutamine amidotransferase